VSLHPACADAVDPYRCLGAFGFNVGSDGVVRMGPDSKGRALYASLAPDELKELNELVHRTFGDQAVLDPGCRLPGAPDLAVTGKGERVTGELATCSGIRDPQAESALSSELGELMRKYSPAEFPADCLDARDAYVQFASAATQCVQDDDCSLIDQDLLPIDPSADVALETDDCTYVPILLAANAFETVAHQRDLILARELAARVCAKSGPRPGCRPEGALESRGTLVRCISHRCRVSRPAA
jgi:hypothetical protein